MTPEARYAELARILTTRANVFRSTDGKGFGSSGQLKADGRIFAMLVKGNLVLKLPGLLVDALVAQGEGKRFDAGKGTPMREWLVLSASSGRRWLPLAQEAMKFVMGPPNP